MARTKQTARKAEKGSHQKYSVKSADGRAVARPTGPGAGATRVVDVAKQNRQAALALAREKFLATQALAAAEVTKNKQVGMVLGLRIVLVGVRTGPRLALDALHFAFFACL